MKEPNLALQVGSGVVGAAQSSRPGDIQGVVSAMDGMMRTSSASKRAQQLTSRQRTSSADVVCPVLTSVFDLNSLCSLRRFLGAAVRIRRRVGILSKLAKQPER